MQPSFVVKLIAGIMLAFGVVLGGISQYNLITLANERASEVPTLRQFREVARSERGTLLPDSRANEVPGLLEYKKQRDTWEHRDRLWTTTRRYCLYTICAAVIIGAATLLPKRRSEPELVHG